MGKLDRPCNAVVLSAGNMFKLIIILCTLAVASVSAAPFSADNIGSTVVAGLSAGHNYTRYSSLSDDTPSPCNIKMPGLFCASCCRHRNVTSMCTYCCGCGGSTLTPPTPPTPTPPVPPTPPPPAPPTPPPPSGCPGGTLSACIGVCPSNPVVAYKACVNACVARCT